MDAGSPHELSSPGTGAEEAPQTESGAGAGAAAVRCPEVIHGQPLTEKKSTFQSHVAVVSSVEEVQLVCRSEEWGNSCYLKRRAYVSLYRFLIMTLQIMRVFSNSQII